MIIRPKLKRGQRLVPVRVQAGVGTRAFVVGDQVSISAAGRGRRFSGAFECILRGEEMGISLGTVNDREPYVGLRLLGGLDTEGVPYPDGVPLLPLDADLYDEQGRSWICIEARVNEALELASEDYTPEDLRIVQVATSPADGDPEDEYVGRHAIAMLQRDAEDTGLGRVRQILYFNQSHAAVRIGERPVRHFFWPAG